MHPKLDAHTEFLARSRRSILIGGQWGEARSGEAWSVENPALAEALGSVAAGAEADVDQAVAAARQALEAPAWSRMSPHDRSRLLLRIGDLIARNAEELAQLETLNNGMPLGVARMLVSAAAETFVYYAGWPTKLYGETLPSADSLFSYTLRQPIGVCGQIVPWNGPIGGAAWKLAAALACGNTVVFKPAEQTPYTTIRLGELLLEADVPAGVVNIVTGTGPAAGAAIARHPGVDKVAFTGSTEVGRQVLMASAGNFKRVTLELGGKSPSLIFADADLDAAAAALAGGFCFLAGQICVAASRILVQSEVHDRFVDALARQVALFQPGDPFDAATTMGPLISRRQLERVGAYIETGVREGAQLVSGGRTPDRPGYFLEPAVFAEVQPSMTIAREEIFGPVTAVMPFREEAEAVRIANASAYGLAASVWTRDINRGLRVSRALEAGTVWINTYSHLDLIAPFGGLKQSGIGKELGRQSLDAYTEVKSIHAKIG
ncbi:MAG: aldehyde dehydrogenase family protein [Caulobacteraceae bacterium]|nr:aldehyde dehydrogenase family protein [Caulobacteraceae bacterium]